MFGFFIKTAIYHTRLQNNYGRHEQAGSQLLHLTSYYLTELLQNSIFARNKEHNLKREYQIMNSETNRIEYKQQLTDDLEKEAVAFLNYPEGGVIYIGIEKTGKAIGVVDMDNDMLKIKDRLKNNIMPSCMGLFDIATENIDSREVIKITFASGPEKPYYIKKLGMSEKGTFIRVGTATEPMPVKMIESLFAKRTRNSIAK